MAKTVAIKHLEISQQSNSRWITGSLQNICQTLGSMKETTISRWKVIFTNVANVTSFPCTRIMTEFAKIQHAQLIRWKTIITSTRENHVKTAVSGLNIKICTRNIKDIVGDAITELRQACINRIGRIISLKAVSKLLDISETQAMMSIIERKRSTSSVQDATISILRIKFNARGVT